MTKAVDAKIEKAFLRAKLAHPDDKQAACDHFFAELGDDREVLRVLAKRKFDEYSRMH
jgi:hypothetical protein